MAQRHNSFGPVKGPIVGSYLPMAASQYFRFNSGAFGYLDSSGHFTGNITATQNIWGWALTPKSVAASSALAYWTSSSTAAADELFIIHSISTVFAMPTLDSTYAAARVGELCDLIAVNDGTGQTANVGTNTQDILRIVGGDITLDIVHVCMNDNELQKDT